MTEVAFHFNVPDKVAYACRLLRKAVGGGSRLVVTGHADTLHTLDAELWTFSPLEFIAHCHVTDPVHMLGASPVIIAATLQETPHSQVLVNLGADVPGGFERFERLIEVVSMEDDDRAGARQRWKHYAERGYSIQRHDRAERGQS
jgi:DNA polymerase-3 subunit chi